MPKRKRTQSQIDYEKRRDEYNPNISIRCRKELLELLENEAKTQNTTRNALIISILSEWINSR